MTHVPMCRDAGVPRSIEVGRILPKFVTPSDVRDLKGRLDPFVRALDQSVADCRGLPDGVRNGSLAFSKAWRAYFDGEESWLHTAAQMDQGEAYEKDITRWQDMIATYKCAPDAPPPAPSDGGSDMDDPGSRRWKGTIKTVAVAGAIVAVVIGVRAVMK